MLRLGAGTLTTGQRLAVQKRAKEADVSVEVNLRDYDAVRLYLYAYATGMTPEVEQALRDKAAEAARALPIHFGSLGILVDASASMEGSADKPLHPMAVALAIRDMLACSCRATVVTCGGVLEAGLLRPAGDTSLAEGLLDLIERQPEAIFVLSDGYENRPAGRFAEVCAVLRQLGVRTPIYQLAPVFAAEATGVRRLAPDVHGEGGTIHGVPALPVHAPDALGLSLLRAMLDVDPLAAVRALVGMTPALSSNSQTASNLLVASP